MAKYTLEMDRWNQVANLPLPSGVGDVDTGLCAVARIVYAVTGNVSDIADCVSPVIRSYMITLNDKLPKGALRGRLGTIEIAQCVLAADASPETEQRRAFLCADASVRVFAVTALTSAGLYEQSAKLAALPEIVDAAAAADNLATIKAAWIAVTAAWDVADDTETDYLGAANAACAAAFFAVTRAADVRAADAVAWAVDAARNVAMTADVRAADAVAWAVDAARNVAMTADVRAADAVAWAVDAARNVAMTADVRAADAVAWAVDAARNVAMTADWEPAFTLLDALLSA